MTVDYKDLLTKRLATFGYIVKDTDEFLLLFSINKTTDYIKNICNVTEIPEELSNTAVDMMAGEVLTVLKQNGSLEKEGIDTGATVKSISLGDTTVTYDTASADVTSIDGFLTYLSSAKVSEVLTCFRKMRW